MDVLDDFARKKTKEWEAKLTRAILLAEIAAFVAVASVSLAIGYFFFEISLIEIAISMVIALLAAVMVGSKLRRVYAEIKHDAIKLIEDYKKKL